MRTNTYLLLNGNCEAAFNFYERCLKRVFDALAANGKVVMPFAQTFFAHRFGTLTDQFGVPWMVIKER